ncbi:MAG: twin-arginine translocase subunit TatC [Muribaculaceae bacterium]|nr:twin-arginine translocase subunit TatC [Muribaculaceae bacterium]
MKDGEMTFWDHLGELRKALLKAAAVTAVTTVVAFCFMPSFFDKVILAPCHATFPLYGWIDSLSKSWGGDLPGFSSGSFDIDLINTEVSQQFMTHMSTSFWVGLIAAFPMVIFFLWRFVAPGLYEKEKRGAKRAFFFGNLMFLAGVAAGYFVIFPITFRFLVTYELSASVNNMISLESYIDLFVTMILVMGVVFELPLLAWLLGRIGILSRSFFRRYHRHAIMVLLILAALITPTGDPFTLMVVFLPLIALWEFSTILVPKAEDDTDRNDEK